MNRGYSINCGPCGCVVIVFLIVAVFLGVGDLMRMVGL